MKSLLPILLTVLISLTGFADEIDSFNSAGEKFNQRNYEAAAKGFREVIALKGDLQNVAKLSLAMCQRKLGDFSTAQAILKGLKSDPKAEDLLPAIEAESQKLKDAVLSTALKEYQAKNYEAALRNSDLSLSLGRSQDAETMRNLTLSRLKSEDRGPYWLLLDLGLGYNSNAFLDGFSEDYSGKPTTQTFFSTGVQSRDLDPYLLRVGYNLYWEELYGLAAARFFSHSLRGQAGYQYKTWVFRLYPFVNYQQLQSEPFLLRVGSGWNLANDWGGWITGFEGEVSKNYGQGGNYSYLNGSSFTARAYGFHTVGNWDLELSYAVSNDDSGDFTDGSVTIPQANFTHGPGARADWNFSADWVANLQLNYFFRGFRQPAQPGAIDRSDKWLQTSLKVGYDYTRALTLYGSLGYLRNASTLSDSNIDDKNYSQFLFLAGASWQLLN